MLVGAIALAGSGDGGFPNKREEQRQRSPIAKLVDNLLRVWEIWARTSTLASSLLCVTAERRSGRK